MTVSVNVVTHYVHHVLDLKLTNVLVALQMLCLMKTQALAMKVGMF